ncbi:MAG: GNAT family N-acetyltransferase [Lysobacteraceae bacterium]
MELEARTLTKAAAIPAAVWDALAGDNPFVSHAFIHGLEHCGCLQPRLGWKPLHLGLFDGERCVAVAPGYLKGNSHGEFVFDHAWAEAYHRYGMDYYPKWLIASPYSPVPGPRLLVGSGDDGGSLRAALANALLLTGRGLGVSSVHINFASEHDSQALPDESWLPRGGWQFHWHNRGHADFDDFLSHFTAKKRKNVRQERSKVAASGLRVRMIDGESATTRELDAMHAFYASTFQHKGNFPVLNRAFFDWLAEQFGNRLLISMAFDGDEAVAGALFLRSADTLYGRYWGADVDVPGLHFELCYYQGIDYCIAHGLQRFEPGAQGEHKIARGFEPVPTRSFHHLYDPNMQRAVRDWLADEATWVERYGKELEHHLPFRQTGSLA